jgi:haloacid dehalogenase superfamily, subfamily IA, variant 1 with third motif having Dx(3-4)D or Dx(3-4)E
MISTLLFDFDGTLADTAASLAAAANHVRQQHSLPPLPASAYRCYASGGVRALLRVGLSITPDDAGFGEARQCFLAYYAEHLAEDISLFPGIAELLDDIDARRFRWGIVTNKAMSLVVPVAKHLGIVERAAVIVAGDTTPYSKPHPAPLVHAMRQIGATPAQCIYIGDDHRDILAAHAAELPGVAVRWGYHPPDDPIETWNADACIDHPRQLLPLVDTWNKR